MRERLEELTTDVLGLKHRADQAGDRHATFVWHVLWQMLGLVLDSGVV